MTQITEEVIKKEEGVNPPEKETQKTEKPGEYANSSSFNAS